MKKIMVHFDLGNVEQLYPLLGIIDIFGTANVCNCMMSLEGIYLR